MSYIDFYYVASFVVGLFFGSFYNVVADRSVLGVSFLRGRSKCDSCNTTLKPYNLIPIFSYVAQKGRCASCGTKLSLYYPLSELMTGFSFLLAAMLSQYFSRFDVVSFLVFLFLLVSFSSLVILFLTDAKYQLLPDSIVYPAIFLVGVLLILLNVVTLKTYYEGMAADAFGKYLIQAGYFKQVAIRYLFDFGWVLISSFGIAGFFLLLILVTKGRGMGGGDVKLGFLIGLINGAPNNILAIFLGFLLGAIFSLVLILLKKKTVKDTIPFGPFLILGCLVAFLWGTQLINWYISLI